MYHIRFRYISTQEFGHLVDDSSIILAERSLNSLKVKDWFYIPNKRSNNFFVKIIKRKFYIRWWVKYLYYANNLIPGGKNFTKKDPRKLHGSRDINLTLHKTKKNEEAYFNFTEEENKLGRIFLDKFGFKKEDKFVCLIVRDSAYKEKLFPNHDWSYHNHRNSDIDTYSKACKELVKRGYWVFRMGSIVNKKFSCKNDKVIDYPFIDNKNDFLDIWLMANCTFCITTSSGLDCVAFAFRKPMLVLNLLPVADIMSYTNCLTYFKTLKYKNSIKSFTLNDYLENNFYSMQEYQEKDIEIIDMTEDEIYNSVIEIDEKIKKNFKNDDNIENEKQDRFWKIFLEWDKKNVWTSNKFKGRGHKLLHPNSKISATFLSNNPDWYN